MDTSLEVFGEQWCFEFGEFNSDLRRVFGIVVIDESAEVSAEAFVRNFELGVERLGPFENVAMCVVESYAESQVAFAIGSFEREADALRLVAREQNPSIDHWGAVELSDGLDFDVDETKNLETSEGLVCPINVGGVIELSRLDEATFFQDTFSQVLVLAVEDFVSVIRDGVGGEKVAIVHENRVVIGDECDVSHDERFLHIETEVCAVVSSKVDGGEC